MIRFLLIILFALTTYPSVLAAQGTSDVAGRWEGAVKLPAEPPFEVIVKLQQAKLQQNGIWRGTIDLLTQGDADVPLQNILVEGKIVTFAIASIPGEPTFSGTRSEDTIEGTFSQSGQSFPFSLTRQVPLTDAERNAALEQGRTLTKLFYNRNFAELYEKFSDQMQTRMSQAELKDLRQQVETQAGREIGLQNETVSKSGDLLTYVRTSEFEKFGSYVAVTWTFTPQGVFETVSVLPRDDIAAPSERLEYKTKTALRLPFDGEWSVFWGGRTLEQNYHVAFPDQRFASDFVVTKGSSSYRGDKTKLENYYCFGRPIYAPGEGTVVETVSNQPDLPIGQSDTENAFGNHVIIDHGDGEFSFLAHLKRGSVKVKSGDEVRAGALLGLCGNSGNTSEPHLHYHMQTNAVPHGGEGLPAQFLDYRADGKRVTRGEPVQGRTIERAE